MKNWKNYRYEWMLGLLVVISLISCVEEDFGTRYGVKGQLQVMGRVTNFNERQVTSRGLKTNEESKISNMSLFIFDNNEKCIDFQHVNSANPVFVVDRHSLSNNELGNPVDSCKLYIVANVFNGFTNETLIPDAKDVIGKDLTADLLTASSPTVGVLIPEKGFPMIGHLDDVNLSENNEALSSDILEIPLEALYAKIVFTIKVTPDQYSDDFTSSFNLSSWEVHNLPDSVSVGKLDSIGQTPFYNKVDTLSYKSRIITGSNPVSGSNELSFSFYMPEHKVNPHTSASEYSYPFEIEDSIAHPEYKEYRQHYKPALVRGKSDYDGKPAFVRIKGIYSNHHGHRKSVQYDVYLGNDNYSNFQIERNCQYNNFITIKGLTNHDGADSTTVAFDHRVTLTEVPMYTVWMERETLLDSHYEVRPIRIKLDEDFPEDGKVEVRILDAENKEWIRMEQKKTSSSVHSESGKRKYFTTNLVKDILKDDTLCTVTSNEDNCIWVYVNENTDTIPTKNLNAEQIKDSIASRKKASRKAIIQIDYYANKNNPQPTLSEKYSFNQRYLYPVASVSRKYVENGIEKPYIYYIEYFEEYLYNFDSDDEYGLTDYEGMPWGLNNVQLSHIHDSFICNETNSDWTSYIGANPLKYDFYIGKHDDDNDNSDVYTKDGGTLHNFAGQEFTKEIAENPNAGIEYRTMADSVRSAVEYCYNKNKRNPDGTVDVKWYLPSADELEDFIVPGYSDFKEFQDNYYWTSQPAYIRNAFYYEYFDGSKSDRNREDTYVFVTYEDNKTHARATKVVYNNSKYDYVLSGLNLTSENATIDCNSPICKDTYFNVMYGWYRWTEWSLFQGTQVKTLEKTFPNDEEPGDQHYNEYIDGRNNNTRYHVELGHLDDLIQKTANNEHGYHPRTKSNRVRCVYKK